MRILMLSQFYPPVVGGQERHVRTLSVELSRRGHRVDLVTLANRTHPAGISDDEGVRIERVRSTAARVPGLYRDPLRPHAPPFADPALSRAVGLRLADGAYDVLHAHDWAVNSALGPARRTATPVVLTLHDYSHVCATKRLIRSDAVCPGPSLGNCLRCATAQHGPAVGPGTVVANRISSRNRLRGVACFVPVSQAVAISTGLLPSTYSVIPNFIPDDLVGQDATARPDGPIVYAGDLSRDKGVEVLLDAYRRLVHPPPLVLAGRSLPGTELDLPPGARVAGVLPHPEVHQLMKGASVVVLPSIVADCCPTVVLEAMAAGRPVVASSTGGIVDLVVDGVTGLLVTPGNVEELHRALAAVVADPAMAGAMGAAGLARVRQFTASAVTDRIEALYRRLPSRTPSPLNA